MDSNNDENIKESDEKKIKKTRKDYNKKFYENHEGSLKQKITCEHCGLQYTCYNKSRHYKSQKHNIIASFIKEKNEKLKFQLKNT